ncbi:MarR family winged helix-turn-helix transcriptional regulator [Actinoplanes teichomyceticus]|uniref:MarR family transcriptional regulator n=1 Tax=Actinoplanes teichomyceticus TaxID=1867 RepID=A0A561VIP8_ACTTI|nr:MarR family winged helix-turn-helix transcriptional regulator [Actinoplanes teichomyceticus]TWG11500.1 MarR family transcriptional regulator [Actinoplanes teichomyceticus]GIF15686.1 MarR family transcriptional regulator [Actinoplanes teichomyceticus]
MTGRHQPDDADELFDAVGAAFARLRRRTTQLPVTPPVERKDLNRNLVLNVVDEAEGEMSVGAVADALAVDPSVASRMVTDCITHGYLVRVPSQSDGRRAVLELTEAGHALRDRFRSQQRQAFEHITRDWPETERRELARLIIKYADSAAAAAGRG